MLLITILSLKLTIVVKKLPELFLNIEFDVISKFIEVRLINDWFNNLSLFVFHEKDGVELICLWIDAIFWVEAFEDKLIPEIYDKIAGFILILSETSILIVKFCLVPLVVEGKLLNYVEPAVKYKLVVAIKLNWILFHFRLSD